MSQAADHLKQCLSENGIEIRKKTKWQQQDAAQERLKRHGDPDVKAFGDTDISRIRKGARL